MYDIIGDIHGYAKTLEAILLKMGYWKNGSTFGHPWRKVIFLGDFIDRGPSIRECLNIAKTMVDHGSALAVMGNHEYNAICYHMRSGDGKRWLREHTEKNVKQHRATLLAFENRESEWKDYLDWFMSLPLFLDLGNLRVVHAFWDDQTLAQLSQRLNGKRLSSEFIEQASDKDSEEYHWIENILKGYEIQLPPGIVYSDKDGFVRGEIRIRWWKQLNNETYRSICVKDGHSLPEILVPENVLKTIPVYPPDAPPVFIGHYWNTGKPGLLAHNVCCVDYSVARGEKLVAYRWDGESRLTANNFVVQECLDI